MRPATGPLTRTQKCVCNETHPVIAVLPGGVAVVECPHVDGPWLQLEITNTIFLRSGPKGVERAVDVTLASELVERVKAEAAKPVDALTKLFEERIKRLESGSKRRHEHDA